MSTHIAANLHAQQVSRENEKNKRIHTATKYDKVEKEYISYMEVMEQERLSNPTGPQTPSLGNYMAATLDSVYLFLLYNAYRKPWKAGNKRKGV